MHVRCPHCHNAIELVGTSELTDVNCASCGSSFNVYEIQTEDPPARWIGHFQLLQQLGSGAFGTVYKAKDTKLDRTVAIKIPRRDQVDPANVEMFLREARAAAQLKHPQIVAVHEVGRDDGTLYIVSDFIQGVTLADRLTAGPFTPREAAELCAQIADALHHAHESGVIHRDLKPQNIMLDGEGRPHIMDFGLAKREAGEITMTVDGKILGTAAYMSPEQARGEAHRVDRRTDVYSLGVILFEVLTGERPFRGNSRMLLHQVIHDEPPSLRRKARKTPRDLETICLKCLQKNCRQRYSTAAECADDIRRWLRGEPIRARPVSSAERVWRWAIRNPAVACLSSAVSILALLLLSPLLARGVQAVKLQIDQTLPILRPISTDRKSIISTGERRFLDVVLAGHSATIGDSGIEKDEALPEGWVWQRALPDVATLPGGDEGDVRLELSPFPRGQSHFRLKLENQGAAPRKLVAMWYASKAGAPPVSNWQKWQQTIDDADCLQIRSPASGSFELAPGQSWHPRLFYPPPPPSPGATSRIAPPLESFNIENGLLCVLTDELDYHWRQRIWIQARPLHPQKYLDMAASVRFIDPRREVVVELNSTRAIRSQLPSGVMQVVWFHLADENILSPVPTWRDFSLAEDQLPITAQIRPKVDFSRRTLRAVLHIDGYPRAAHFRAIPAESKPSREPYVQTQYFRQIEPGHILPVSRYKESTLTTNGKLQLDYVIHADFDDRRSQSLRLISNDNISNPIVRLMQDRQFVVRCRKPANPEDPQFAIDCEVREWSGNLGNLNGWLRNGKNVFRAEIVELVDGQERPLALPTARDELVIELDTERPRITSDMPASIDCIAGTKVEISFDVSDDQLDDVGFADILFRWATAVEKEMLVAPREMEQFVEYGPVKQNRQHRRCELPVDITANPGVIPVFVQVQDNAGNVSLPTKVCEINVRARREIVD